MKKQNEVVTVYTGISCGSSRKVISHLEGLGIPCKKVCIKNEGIDRAHLIEFLRGTENGTVDIIKSTVLKDVKKFFKKEKIDYDLVLKQFSATANESDEDIEEDYQETVFDLFTLNELIDFLAETPSALKTPLLIRGDRTIIGFSEEKVRTFVPREVRQQFRLQAM